MSLFFGARLKLSAWCQESLSADPVGAIAKPAFPSNCRNAYITKTRTFDTHDFHQRWNNLFDIKRTENSTKKSMTSPPEAHSTYDNQKLARCQKRSLEVIVFQWVLCGFSLEVLFLIFWSFLVFLIEHIWFSFVFCFSLEIKCFHQNSQLFDEKIVFDMRITSL